VSDLKILHVVGARPNFMKIAPILRAMKNDPFFQSVLVHTNQHYDVNMSDVFFRDLGIPEPDVHLNVGSGTHAVQTAEIMKRFEDVLQKKRPDVVLVVGDVNSTLACSITASKLCIPVAHVEAGLRSNDRSMPEEINRLVTDVIAEYLFTTEKSGTENLLKEGKPQNQIFFVGHVMIDSLVYAAETIAKSEALTRWNVKPQEYIIVTLHRPSNVDQPETLEKIFNVFDEIRKDLKIIFPIHPRTINRIKSLGFEDRINGMNNLIFTEPLGYIDFLKLMKHAKFVLTDSGGLQEETTYLRIPCLTMRANTERPVTVEVGTNTLVGLDEGKILSCFAAIMNGTYKSGRIPELWDGRAAERIAECLKKSFMQVA